MERDGPNVPVVDLHAPTKLAELVEQLMDKLVGADERALGDAFERMTLEV